MPVVILAAAIGKRLGKLMVNEGQGETSGENYLFE